MKQSVRGTITIIFVGLLAAGCSKHEEKPEAAARQVLPAKEELTGEALFIERCRDCHGVQQKGTVIGPDLSKIGSSRDRAYFERMIREPSKVSPGTVMPPHDTLSTKQVNSLVDYLVTLK